MAENITRDNASPACKKARFESLPPQLSSARHLHAYHPNKITSRPFLRLIPTICNGLFKPLVAISYTAKKNRK
ncbi:hypothetical protein [Methylobacter sp.]|uniref:hypothetical protein n=1 Tax=Methylobacter sp. TaxID=2051955 RepID=UPI003DA3E47C